MSHEHAFLQDITEHPDDDTPRLVYADWLEDHGQGDADRARAEFIRLQCERASLDEHALVRAAQLEQREAELWKKHGKAWSAPLRRYSNQFAFRRGFTDRLTLRADVFMEHAKDIARLTPLFDVKLRECKGVVAELAACKHLHKVRGLDLDFNNLAVSRLRTFLASKHLTNLRSLNLTNNSLSSGAGEVLARAEGLANLTELTLDNNPLANAGFEALARAPWLGRLRTLRLAATKPQASGLRALLEGLSPELRHLDLSDNHRLGNEGLIALAGSPRLRGLTTLGLADLNPSTWPTEAVPLDAEGARALARSRHLTSLTTLNLWNNTWLGRNLEALAARPLPALRSLDLGRCRLGFDDLPPPAGPQPGSVRRFEEFIRSPFVTRLTSLDLSANPLDPRTLTALAGSPALKKLAALSLSRVSLKADGGEALAGHVALPALTHLDLWGCGLGNAGVAALARCPGAARLKTLDLRGNRVTQEGAKALAASPRLAGLEALDLRDDPPPSRAGPGLAGPALRRAGVTLSLIY